ncbi:MAG: CHC2 zinc finger domain-containing protein [Pseudomonadota bacterium]
MTKVGLLDLVAIKNNTPMAAVLDHYNLDTPAKGGDQVMIKSPFYDDKTPSCSVNLARGIFKCFGSGNKGNVLEFIALMEDLPENSSREYKAALQALEIIGEDATQYKKDQTPQKAAKESKKKKSAAPKPRGKKKRETAPEPPPEVKKSPAMNKENAPIDVALVLDYEHQFLADRGITPEVAESFGIGYCRVGIMKNRIAIPIHNPGGELVAFTGRWADEDNQPEHEPRYKLPKGYAKSLELWNLHRAIEFNKSYVVIVEGIWSAIRLHTSGVPSVALLGTDVSETQAGRLAQAGFRHAVLILDGDEAGRLATPAALHILSQSLYVRTLVLTEGIKPDTMDEAIVRRLHRK